MATIEESYNKAKRLQSSYKDIVKNVMKELEKDFIEANRKQLEQGQKANGEPMPMYSGGAYERIKAQIGSQSLPHMDYKLSGAFHKSISAFTDNTGTELHSVGVDYAKDLERRVNPQELYGNTEESLEKIRPKAIIIMQNELRKVLGI